MRTPRAILNFSNNKKSGTVLFSVVLGIMRYRVAHFDPVNASF